jgi:hypothetical protein
MILLSDRYKADVSFWFSLFHEAAHILFHSKKELFVSEADGGDHVSQQEEDEANTFAANQLIPRQFVHRLRDLRTDADVIGFPRQSGSPGDRRRSADTTTGSGVRTAATACARRSRSKISEHIRGCSARMRTTD